MINTPFNYTCSKYNLLEKILPFFDYDKKYFIDVFTRGGSVYTNVVEKYEKVLINDIIEDFDSSKTNSIAVSGVYGEHKNGKRSKLIDDLLSYGFKYEIIEHNYEKVARNKNTKNSKEILIYKK